MEQEKAKKHRQSGSVSAMVEERVRGEVEELGLELWDVQYQKEGAGWVLRIVIDRDGAPIDTDACEKVSRRVDPLLDEWDLIDHSYCLEVSSPGLGRKLEREEHFRRMAGKEVELGLYKADETGEKTLRGTLLGMEEGAVKIETEAGPRRVEKKAISKAKLTDDENLF